MQNTETPNPNIVSDSSACLPARAPGLKSSGRGVKSGLHAGANPDLTDSAAGFSARDYARRDTRSRQILQLIESKKPKPAAALR